MSEPARWSEVDARTITRIPGEVDPWFLARYGMNLYRGCEHGCAYCDGRAEKYHVAGEFDRDITVKRNAVELAARAFARVREPGFVFLGGGVCDAWQPAEARYRLARGVLERVREAGLPVHVLSKSALLARDLDLLGEIGRKAGAIVSMSIATTDEDVRRRFEPGAAPIEARWRVLAQARELGLGTGVMAMPVLPGFSDQAEAIEALVARAAAEGVDFLCFGGLTLRPGAQMDTTLAAVREAAPEHLPGYRRVWREGRPSGEGDRRYYDRIEARYRAAWRRHAVPGRPPRRLFHGRMPRYAEVAVLLEHRDFLRRLEEARGPTLAPAGWAIQRWARGRFAAYRSRRYTWRQLEAEFLDRVEDGSLAAVVDGVDGAALEAVRALV